LPRFDRDAADGRLDLAAGIGLENYVQAFQAHDIDAEVLPRLTADDLAALGVTSVGHRRKLLDAIAALDRRRAPAATERIVVGARPVEAERRQLTVLFCDLVGSTELAARVPSLPAASGP
jgi:class 3 adenylate cyclase